MKMTNRTWILLSALVFFCVLAVIGPLDLFRHGFFCEEIDYEHIAPEDYTGVVDLKEEEYMMVFRPKDKYLTGFEVLLLCQGSGNAGHVVMTVSDEEANVLDMIRVDLSQVTSSWYKVRTHADYDMGKNYAIRFSVEDSEYSTYMLTVNNDYLPDETIGGEGLVCYAYKKSDFSFSNKVLISLILIAGWMFVVSFFVSQKKQNTIRKAACFILVVSGLSWNYMYNSMDDTKYQSPDNWYANFPTFQTDSESLVMGRLYAEKMADCYWKDFEQEYGLGRYYDLRGWIVKDGLKYRSDDDWDEGYSNSDAAIIVNSNPYSRIVASLGNYVFFKNGESYQIDSINDDGTDIVIHLISDHLLNRDKNGSLDQIRFLDGNGNLYPRSILVSYKSQYGLQGKVFSALAGLMKKEDMKEKLNLLCSMASAIVFTVLVVLVDKKYNRLLAGCFLFVFWLSPWVVDFARNLYWVEFTWFIPMVIGLLCSWKIDDGRIRKLCYVLAFASILVKCLCGYEYITVIMMGMIAFLLCDLAEMFAKKDRKKAKVVFRTIIILGVTALAGFFMAILLHASFRGEGNLGVGVKRILEEDALRRTYGADITMAGSLNSYKDDYSITASAWETICQYFHFYTQIVTGVGGNLFGLLCVVPLMIFANDHKKKSLDMRLPAMYVVFFITSVSWFVLAKSHSYVHTHMNYVLWYFGFVQICFYIILNKIIELTTCGQRLDNRTLDR